ncbi:proteinase-activated receptor 4 isoform X1 [Arapaima gigas]
MNKRVSAGYVYCKQELEPNRLLRRELPLSMAPSLWLLLAVCWLLGELSTPTPTPATEDCSGWSGPRSFIPKTRCNKTVLDDKEKKEIKGSTTVLVVPIMYVAAFLVGLPANLLALWVLVFHTKRLPSTTLLINLTVADLLLLLVLPFRARYHFAGNDWTFGEPVCRLVMAILYGSMYGSVLCLMLISADRYVALVHPFGARSLRSQRTSLIMSLAVWTVAIAAMVPLLFSHQSYKLHDPSITTCHDVLPLKQQTSFFFPYFACLFALCFLLPLFVILFCYGAVLHTLLASGRRYAHAVCLIALVLLVFVICFLPTNLLLLLHYSDVYTNGDNRGLYVPYMVTLAISCFGPCIDPFIYYFVSDDFRAKVRRILCCCGTEDKVSSGKKTTSSLGDGQSRSTLLSKSCANKGPIAEKASENGVHP